MGFADQNHIFLDMTRPYLILLQDDEPSPFVDEPVEEPVTSAGGEGARAEGGDTDAAGFEIDLDGLERRLLAVPGVAAGSYFRLTATGDGFLYLRKTGNEFLKYQVITDRTSDRADLYHYNLAAESASKLMDGINNYHLSADGNKLVYRAGGTYGVVNVGRSANVGDGKVDYGDYRMTVDRAGEYAQMFDEAWRIQRDWFYDPNLHGVNWERIREKYRRFLPSVSNRSDLNYLIGEMIGELNIGHTYVWGGDIADEVDNISTGLLGADVTTDGAARYYKLERIIPGTPGDPTERSPLDAPGCGVEAGDYLIAIDGEEVTADENLYAHLVNKAGDYVTITYNDRPSAENAEQCRVRTIGSEGAIRYRDWVNRNRRKVHEATDGRVGYVHLPDMMQGGLIEFARAWYPNHRKEGFVVDVRYNGGGFTGDMIIDRLEREVWALTKPREGDVLHSPERGFAGHWVLLINEDTGSNGEMFSEAIKIKQLAPVIGMRTWGGAVGIEPHQALVDGGTVTPPQFGLYGLDRRWLIEGRGVEPDVEVQNEPGDVLAGRDAQLEAGIRMVLEQIQADPMELPSPPAYPDKSKPRGS